MLKVQKEMFVSFMKAGDDTAVRSAIAALPESMAEETGVLSLRIYFALNDRDRQQAIQFLEKIKGGEDDGTFSNATVPVPVGCYSILLARLQGEQTEARSRLKTRASTSPGENDFSRSVTNGVNDYFADSLA